MTNVWQTAKALGYRRGSFISETIGKKAPVPAYENTIVVTAEEASAKVGLPKSLKSDCHSPSPGAAEGRSWTPTAIVTVKTIEQD